MQQNLEAVYRSNEVSKKRYYNQRVIQIEHSSFTLVVMSSMGGFGKESSRFISKLVENTAEKNGIEASVVASYIRTKISYELIRSQVACIRGSRGLWKNLS